MHGVNIGVACVMCSPKPNHYLEWLVTGKCAFRGMCELVSCPAVNYHRDEARCELHLVRCAGVPVRALSVRGRVCAPGPRLAGGDQPQSAVQ